MHTCIQQLGLEKKKQQAQSIVEYAKRHAKKSHTQRQTHSVNEQNDLKTQNFTSRKTM